MLFKKTKRKYWQLIIFFLLPLYSLIIIIADLICKNFQDNTFSESWFKIILAFPYVIIVYLLMRTTEKNQIQYGTHGLKFPEWNNETYEWNQISFKLEDKKIFSIIPNIRVDMILKDKSTYMEYDITDMGSFFELVLNYCPKDHDLYKLVEEYQKK